MSEGRLILYMGGPTQSRERMTLGSLPISPRSLVLAPQASLPRIRILCREHAALTRPQAPGVCPMFNGDSICIASHGRHRLRLIRERAPTHMLIAGVAQMFGPTAGLLDWIYQLAKIVLEQPMTLIVDIASDVVKATQWWQSVMSAFGLSAPSFVTFGCNTHAEPVQYARYESLALQQYNQEYAAGMSDLQLPIPLFKS